MTALKIIGGILIIFILVSSAMAINQYSLNKYRYKPFNLGNTGAMALAIILVIISIFVLPEGQSLHMFFTDIANFNITEENSNSMVLIATSLLIAVFVYVNLIIKTNLLVATYSIVVQFCAALVIILAIVALSGNKSQKNAA